MIDVGDLDTPIGSVRFAVRDGRLGALFFADPGAERLLERRFGRVPARRAGPNGVPDSLRRYFDGDLTALDAIAVDPGGTPFQRAVWRALRRIPAGATASYAQIARAAGSPRAVRAAGTAIGANPVGIVIPCHRVIRGDGRLGGYAGGLRRKRWLLAHEAAARG